MDPLALLSDDEEGEASGGEAAPQQEEAPAAKRPRLAADGAEDESLLDAKAQEEPAPDVSISFNDLQHAGYQPTELLETAAYLRDAEGQELRRPKPPPSEDCPAAAEGEEDEPESSCALPPRPPPEVHLQGSGDLPAAWTSFGTADGSHEEGGLPPEVRGPLLTAGFMEPTPIQAHAVPLLLAGRDLVGVAETGSGKTLAYLLPCLTMLLRGVADAIAPLGAVWSPPALVLAPTRELVCQIEREADRFQRSVGFRIAAVYGGAPRQPQLAALRACPELVAATPGRLIDFLKEEQGPVSLQRVRFLVLDEADRMLDDGFEPQIRDIIRQASGTGRQTLMFSATWPPGVQQLATDFLRDPVEVRVGLRDALCANPDVTQDVSFCEDHEKNKLLVSILRSRARARAIVFVATKRSCRDLARSVRSGVPGRCDAIHGDRSQAEREAALAAFRAGEVRVLFATDVAGRGLDIPGVTLVVNFDPPRSAEDYVHRIGRTGRAGEKGLAVSLLTPRDSDAARAIAEVMKRTGLRVPPELVRRVGPDLVADKPEASRTAVMRR